MIERLSHPLFVDPTVKICQCINRFSHVIELCGVPLPAFVRRSAINKTSLLDAIKCVRSITKYEIQKPTEGRGSKLTLLQNFSFSVRGQYLENLGLYSFPQQDFGTVLRHQWKAIDPWSSFQNFFPKNIELTVENISAILQREPRTNYL